MEGIAMRQISLSVAAVLMLAMLVKPTQAAELKPTYAGEMHTDEVQRVTVFQDGRHYVSQSGSETMIWDARTGRRVAHLNDGSADASRWLSATDDQAKPEVIVRIEGAGADRRVVDVVTGATLATLGAGDEPRAAIATAQGLILVTGLKETGGYRVRVWAPGGKTVRAAALIVPPGADASVSEPSILVARDARWLAVTQRGRVDLIDGVTGRTRPVKLPGKAATDEISALGFSGTGRDLMIAGKTNTIHVLKADDLTRVRGIELTEGGQQRRFTEIEAGRVIRIDGRRTTGYADVNTGKTIWHARGSSVSSYVFEPLGNSLYLRASRTRNNPVTHGVYRHQAGAFKLLWRKQEVGLDLSAMSGSGNGRCLILAGPEVTRVVDPVTGQDIARLQGLLAPLAAAVFAPDGARLVTGDGQGRVAVTAMPAVCAGAR
jgi:hypothetical protein